ncbi:hypothetical protein J6590_052516 [Homalodisca vitripennis]|nr:hypothetical protein J6590_052516 [Homalodisca vitripennis]
MRSEPVTIANGITKQYTRNDVQFCMAKKIIEGTAGQFCTDRGTIPSSGIQRRGGVCLRVVLPPQGLTINIIQTLSLPHFPHFGRERQGVMAMDAHRALGLKIATYLQVHASTHPNASELATKDLNWIALQEFKPKPDSRVTLHINIPLTVSKERNLPQGHIVDPNIISLVAINSFDGLVNRHSSAPRTMKPNFTHVHNNSWSYLFTVPEAYYPNLVMLPCFSACRLSMCFSPNSCLTDIVSFK